MRPPAASRAEHSTLLHCEGRAELLQAWQQDLQQAEHGSLYECMLQSAAQTRGAAVAPAALLSSSRK
jgi:hypothetical protein